MICCNVGRNIKKKDGLINLCKLQKRAATAILNKYFCTSSLTILFTSIELNASCILLFVHDNSLNGLIANYFDFSQTRVYVNKVFKKDQEDKANVMHFTSQR